MSARCALVLWTAVLAAGMVLAAGCEAPYRPMPYRPKPLQAPPVLACHDAIGHVTGNKPWIMGGQCCCTPTPANFAMHQHEGTVDKPLAYEAYLDMYKSKGITTDLDHKSCGNLCPCGPHVTLGGRCMATPTPGTPMYERVTYGPHGPLK